MEWSWNDSSSVPDYAEETFASFNEGEEETCRQYENDLFESYYSGEESERPAASDLPESPCQSSSQDEEVEQDSELLDSEPVEEHLTRRWIRTLKSNRTNTGVAIEQNNGAALTRTAGESEEELGALRSFCATRINQLCHPPSAAPVKIKRNHPRRGSTLEKPLQCDLNLTVPEQLVNRLHLRNIEETMKQLAGADMHQPSRCPHCLGKRAELAKAAFLRRRKALMEEALLQEKLDEHLYTKDSLTLIGEIHKILPNLSEDPRNIWQKQKERTLKA
ncbi:hypothetical protein EYD10_09005 [Varanus komodoensis]|uniref:Uncharacterized protein n=1 Tax=Varanus komodoensis TaxID=61221 RepID=A0A8D2L009_VARKO|nr:uncharacterized protein C8orf48 homolog [Varanus komodoensis]XP_044283342.1 uncharacterized protein C8orf48 homolog [Varanus komodoensis]KAF7244905.1 hypothetical protein EYD10_09005 [Varanus komodoensis]